MTGFLNGTAQCYSSQSADFVLLLTIILTIAVTTTTTTTALH